jgi:hypothetical protein
MIGAKTACVILMAATFAQGAAVSEEDIQHWLAVWQKREGLEDRNIRYRFVHQRELGGNFIADVEWWETPGQARIRFIYPAELETVIGDTPAEAREDAQRSVIHELMHLIIAGLYDDGSGRGNAWISSVPARDARMEAITENLAVMLLHRHAPGGLSVAEYVRRQVNSGPWKPDAEVKRRVMLQVVHAINAASEDDVMAFFVRRND